MSAAVAIRAPRKRKPLEILDHNGEVVKRVGRQSPRVTARPDDGMPSEQLWTSYHTGELGWPKQWNEQVALEKYTGTVYTAADAIANRVARTFGTMWLEAENQSGETVELERHQILRALASPNPVYKTGRSLVKITSIDLDLCGNAYWIKIRDPLGAVIGFWPLFPQLTKVVCMPGEFIVGVHFYPDGMGGEPLFFPIADVIHFKLENPSDHVYGWSTLRAAAYETNTAESIRLYQQNWFKNQMRPDYVISVNIPAGPKMQEQLDIVRARVRMYHQGARRHGEPLILPAESKLEQIQFSLVDSQFLQQADFSDDRILRVLKVPKWVVAPEGFATRAAATQAAIEFAENSIEPRLDVIFDTLNAACIDNPNDIPRPDGVTLRLRRDSAAPRDEEFVNTNARENFKAGLITRDEAREDMGWDAATAGGDEYAPAPSALPVSVSSAREDAEKAHGFVGLDADAVAAIAKAAALTAVAAITTHAVDAEPTRKAPEPFDLDTDEKRAEHWRKAIKPQDQAAARATRVLRSFFRAQAARVLSQMETEIERLAGKMAGWSRAKVLKHFAHTKMGKDDPGFDAEAERERIVNALHPMSRSAIDEAGKIEARHLGLAWDIENAGANRWLESHVAQVAEDITSTTAELLSATVRDGVADGKSTGEIMRDLRTVYDSWSGEGYDGDGVLPGYRAARIARTEIGAAFGFGQQVVLEEANYEGLLDGVMWITARDDVVRPEHQIDGEIVGVGERFSNGMLYPGDMTVSDPGLFINCRCTQAAVVKGSA